MGSSRPLGIGKRSLRLKNTPAQSINPKLVDQSDRLGELTSAVITLNQSYGAANSAKNAWKALFPHLPEPEFGTEDQVGLQRKPISLGFFR